MLALTPDTLTSYLKNIHDLPLSDIYSDITGGDLMSGIFCDPKYTSGFVPNLCEILKTDDIPLDLTVQMQGGDDTILFSQDDLDVRLSPRFIIKNKAT